jgi:hypothetical protein
MENNDFKLNCEVQDINFGLGQIIKENNDNEFIVLFDSQLDNPFEIKKVSYRKDGRIERIITKDGSIWVRNLFKHPTLLPTGKLRNEYCIYIGQYCKFKNKKGFISIDKLKDIKNNKFFGESGAVYEHICCVIDRTCLQDLKTFTI